MEEHFAGLIMPKPPRRLGRAKTSRSESLGGGPVQAGIKRSLVPRPFYARGARWERDKGLVPVVRACVEFYWNPGKIVFFGIF